MRVNIQNPTAHSPHSSTLPPSRVPVPQGAAAAGDAGRPRGSPRRVCAQRGLHGPVEGRCRGPQGCMSRSRGCFRLHCFSCPTFLIVRVVRGAARRQRGRQQHRAGQPHRSRRQDIARRFLLCVCVRARVRACVRACVRARTLAAAASRDTLADITRGGAAPQRGGGLGEGSTPARADPGRLGATGWRARMGWVGGKGGGGGCKFANSNSVASSDGAVLLLLLLRLRRRRRFSDSDLGSTGRARPHRHEGRDGPGPGAGPGRGRGRTAPHPRRRTGAAAGEERPVASESPTRQPRGPPGPGRSESGSSVGVRARGRRGRRRAAGT